MKVRQLGSRGVNVDKAEEDMADNEFRKTQNAIGTKKGLQNRPGLQAYNATTAAGAVLGGQSVPLRNRASSGTRYFYIGRGPTT